MGLRLGEPRGDGELRELRSAIDSEGSITVRLTTTPAFAVLKLATKKDAVWHLKDLLVIE